MQAGIASAQPGRHAAPAGATPITNVRLLFTYPPPARQPYALAGQPAGPRHLCGLAGVQRLQVLHQLRVQPARRSLRTRDSSLLQLPRIYCKWSHNKKRTRAISFHNNLN